MSVVYLDGILGRSLRVIVAKVVDPDGCKFQCDLHFAFVVTAQSKYHEVIEQDALIELSNAGQTHLGRQEDMRGGTTLSIGFNPTEFHKCCSEH